MNLTRIPRNVRLFASPSGDDKTDRILAAAQFDAGSVVLADGHNVLNPDRWPWIESTYCISTAAPQVILHHVSLMQDGQTMVIIGFDTTCRLMHLDPVEEMIRINQVAEERGVRIFATWSDTPAVVTGLTLDITSREAVEAAGLEWDENHDVIEPDSYTRELDRIMAALDEKFYGRYFLLADDTQIFAAVLSDGNPGLSEIMPTAVMAGMATAIPWWDVRPEDRW